MNALPLLPEEMLTVDDFARITKTSKSMIYKLVSDGRLTCVRIGSLIRFTPTAVAEFIAKAQGAQTSR